MVVLWKTLFWRTFRFSCWVLFVIQAFNCTEQFMVQKPATATSYDKQEKWPLPSVCFGSTTFFNETLKSLVTKEEYDNGRWRIDQLNISEKELFDSLTPRLHDLVYLAKIDKFIHEKG